MAPKQGAIDQNDMVSQCHVVADMAMSHQKIVRADHRLLSTLVGAVDGDVFAEDVPLADAQAGRLALVFQVLGSIADHAAGVELIVRPNAGRSSKVDVRPDPAIRADNDLSINHSVWPALGRTISSTPAA